MAIDVPYSFLVRDGDQAWSCGQLALDRDANVLAAGDLVAQSQIVAGHVAEIIGRAGMAPADVARLVLFTHAGHMADADAMCSAFRAALSPDVILDVVAVPHFYYDGVVLEVDVFCGALGPASPTAPGVSIRRDAEMAWVSINSGEYRLDDVLSAVDVDTSALLSAHWTAPDEVLGEVTTVAAAHGLLPDAGAVTTAGRGAASANGRLVFTTDSTVQEPVESIGPVIITGSRSHRFGWVQARSVDTSAGLVEQTRQIMAGIEQRLGAHGVDFDAVVKATSLYVGGSSAEELHDNMTVRNGYYTKPGPASTGLPVFGLAGDRSRIVVDVTYAKGSANGSSGRPADG